MNCDTIDQNSVPIKDIKYGDRNFNITCIVLEIVSTTNTKDGQTVRTFKVADRTASINLTVWDEMGSPIKNGDILRVLKTTVTIFKQCLILNVMKTGRVFKIGDFCMLFAEFPFMSTPNENIIEETKQKLQQQQSNQLSPSEPPSSQPNSYQPPHPAPLPPMTSTPSTYSQRMSFPSGGHPGYNNFPNPPPETYQRPPPPAPRNVDPRSKPNFSSNKNIRFQNWGGGGPMRNDGGFSNGRGPYARY